MFFFQVNTILIFAQKKSVGQVGKQYREASHAKFSYFIYDFKYICKQDLMKFLGHLEFNLLTF